MKLEFRLNVLLLKLKFKNIFKNKDEHCVQHTKVAFHIYQYHV